MRILDEAKARSGREKSELLSFINGVYRDGTNHGELGEALQYLHDNSTETFYKNIFLNRLEYLSGKTLLVSKPQHLLASLSDKCNLNCAMCYEKTGSVIPEAALDEFTALFPYARRVEWIGGEVLLLENFERLFDAAAKYPHISQIITTNGTLVDEKWANKFIANSVEVRFSIDGVTKGTYERIRRGASFEGLLANLELIKRLRLGRPRLSRPLICMSFIVMRSNYREIPEVIGFAKAHGIEHVNFLRLLDFNRESYVRENIDSDPRVEEYLSKAFGRVEELSGKLGVSYIIHFALGGRKRGSFNEALNGEKSRPCRVPWEKIEICGDHRVRPYCHCDFVGSVAKNSLGEIWNGEEMRNYRERLVRLGQENSCGSECLERTFCDATLFD